MNFIRPPVGGIEICGVRYGPNILLAAEGCTPLFGKVGTSNDVDAMRQVTPDYFLPQRHAIALGYPPRWPVLRANQRNNVVNFEVGKPVVAAGAGGLCSQALAPVVTAQVISTLDFVHAVYALLGQAGIANH